MAGGGGKAYRRPVAHRFTSPMLMIALPARANK